MYRIPYRIECQVVMARWKLNDCVSENHLSCDCGSDSLLANFLFIANSWRSDHARARPCRMNTINSWPNFMSLWFSENHVWKAFNICNFHQKPSRFGVNACHFSLETVNMCTSILTFLFEFMGFSCWRDCLMILKLSGRNLENCFSKVTWLAKIWISKEKLWLPLLNFVLDKRLRGQLVASWLGPFLPPFFKSFVFSFENISFIKYAKY